MHGFDRQRVLNERSIASNIRFVIPPRNVVQQDNRPEQLQQWSGTPLDRVNRGCYLETGTMLCLIGDLHRIEAAAVVDQTGIEFVALGQRVTLWSPQAPGRRMHGKVAEISERTLDKLPRELAAGGRIAADIDASGTARPRSSSYPVRVEPDEAGAVLLPWTTGTAVIQADPQSSARRLLRYLRRTLRFKTQASGGST